MVNQCGSTVTDIAVQTELPRSAFAEFLQNAVAGDRLTDHDTLRGYVSMLTLP